MRVRGLLSTPAAAVPALALIYLLGIVLDRLADAVLHGLRSERQWLKYYMTENESFLQRGYVLTNSTYFAKQFDYSRSRQRIAGDGFSMRRLLAITLNILLITRPGVIAHPVHLSVFLTPTLLLVAAACWFSWEKLADTELKVIRDQAEWLRETEKLPSSSSLASSSDEG